MAAAMVNQSSRHSDRGDGAAIAMTAAATASTQIAGDQGPADALLQQAERAAAVDLGAAATAD